MACPNCNRGNRSFQNGRSGCGNPECRSCGNRCSRRNSSGEEATAAVAAATAAAVAATALGEQREEIGCSCSSIASEFYGGECTAAQQTLVTCCDPVSGCQEYDLATRCPFWPTFAHPRWLSCSQLYSRRLR